MKNRIYLLTFLAILFSTILFSHHSFAKETSAKGIPQQLEELTKQLNELSATVAEQQNSFLEVQTKHQEDINGLKELVKSQASEISNLQNTVNTQQETIKQLMESSKIQGDNLSSLQSMTNAVVEKLNNLSNQFNMFKDQVQMQMNKIFVELDLIKKKLPMENQTGYTISGKMEDSDGKPFFSGFTLKDSKGSRYSVSKIGQDGSFSFSNIPNGTYTINYYFQSYQVESPNEIVVNGKDINSLLIKLAVPTFTVSGKAITSDGAPIPFTKISLVQNGNIGGYWPSTSSNGSFSLTGVAPGNYTLIIGDNQNPGTSVEVQVLDQDINNLIVQGKLLYSVSGFLVDSNSEIFYTAFNLVDENNNSYYSVQEGNKFIVKNVPDGIYRVRFAINPYQSVLEPNVQITVNGHNVDEYVIKINAPTYYVSGIALDKNGLAIGEQRIHIFDQSGSGWGDSLRTDSNGRFVVPGLPNGTYILKIGNDHNNPIVQGQVTIQDGNVVGIVIQQN